MREIDWYDSSFPKSAITHHPRSCRRRYFQALTSSFNHRFPHQSRHPQKVTASFRRASLTFAPYHKQPKVLISQQCNAKESPRLSVRDTKSRMVDRCTHTHSLTHKPLRTKKKGRRSIEHPGSTKACARQTVAGTIRQQLKSRLRPLFFLP